MNGDPVDICEQALHTGSSWGSCWGAKIAIDLARVSSPPVPCHSGASET
jgi:hypothetical protein